MSKSKKKETLPARKKESDSSVKKIIVEQISLSKMSPAAYNPREISDSALHGLEKSIETFGYVEPIIWNQRSGNCLHGNRGLIFFTVNLMSVKQNTTQENPGGLTELYLDYGTYVKSFYTILYCPSSVKIGTLGFVHKRLHHEVKWKNTVPCILHEKYRKVSGKP